jgi:hypothetical protein
MTRTTNARLAGFTFLFYIAVAFPAMVLFDKATSAQGTAAKLVRIAQHVSDVRIAIVLSLLGCVSALVLAVTLYAITRDEDQDIAMLGLTFRVGEGVIGAIFVLPMLGLLWLATPDAATMNSLGAFLLKVQSWSTTISATFFAVGSTLFSYLFLRGRTVPFALAWLGVFASVLVVVGLPLQLVGLLHAPVILYMWFPMLAFEVSLGFWLLIKGVAPPATR